MHTVTLEMGAPIAPKQGTVWLRPLAGMIGVIVLLIMALADCKLRVPEAPPKATATVRLGTANHARATRYEFPTSVRVAGATSKHIDRELVPEVLPSLASALKGGGVAGALVLGCAGAPPIATAINTAGIKVCTRTRV